MNILTQAPALNPLSFIDKLISEIELSPTQYGTAKRSYEAVAKVLNKEESSIKICHPSIFPQGSIRIGTTVKPVEQEEFDLDMVCWLGISGKYATADQVYEFGVEGAR
jgi:Second Messenger Oligonucleotide or Dinucleotide Synthetase domain